MTSLLALWNTSLALSAVALVALMLLLSARYLGGRRSTVLRQTRRELTAALLSNGPMPDLHSRLQREIAADVAIEMAELVRGSDRDRLLANATQLGVPEVLRRRLHSRISQDRLTAAEMLAMFPPEINCEALVALNDRNRDVRLGAALALAQNHAAPNPSDLIRQLRIGTEERSLLVVSLMRDLAETDPDGVEALLYDPTLPDDAKLAVTDALAATGMVENAPLVAWMAGAAANDRPLQPRIYRALGRIGHPGAREKVVDGLSSPDWEVRTSAAEAAGRIGLTDTVDRLGALLDDKHWWVRFRAGEALARLGPAGRNGLLQAAEHGGQLARIAATATLAERKLQ